MAEETPHNNKKNGEKGYGGYKQRLVPYKILGMLLYGNHDFMEASEEGDISVKSGPFCRILRIPNHSLREAIIWLHRMGLIESYGFSYGKVSVRLKTPRNPTGKVSEHE